MTIQEKKKLQRVGLTRLNSPKRTPKHATKKGIVAIRENGKIRIIRFGAQGMGHNYSPEARKSFKARHGKNIAKGKKITDFIARLRRIGTLSNICPSITMLIIITTGSVKFNTFLHT